MGKVLDDVRKKLASESKNELETLNNSEYLKELFGKIQDLKIEMNQAKQEAAQEAAKPFLEAISEIESKYSLYIRLGVK